VSTTHITPAVLARAEWHLDASGVTDLVCPPRQPGQHGRKGMVHDNTRLLLLGWILTTMLGMETTLHKVHDVLTQNLTRDDQWRLGVLRPSVTTRQPDPNPVTPDVHKKQLSKRGKRIKTIWTRPDGVVCEVLGYDDLVNAVRHFRERFDYGPGTAPDLDPVERARREQQVAAMVDALIAPTLLPRPKGSDVVALDATGQWAWSIGPPKVKHAMEDEARKQRNNNTSPDDATNTEDTTPPLEAGDIATDDEDDDSDVTAPADPPPTPAELSRRCPDAAWGYRTEKDGRKGPGFGFHQHTIVRVPNPAGPSDAEPHLVEGFVITPANADVVDASLALIDRIRATRPFKTIISDLLYTNLKADRWAIALAERGVEQCLAMSDKKHHNKVVSVRGALMQYHWLHCPAAPMADRPTVPDRATEKEWEAVHFAVEDFQNKWAFSRKESGLYGTTSKWICPLNDGRAGCTSDPASLQTALKSELPIITAPTDWRSRDCCTKTTIDIRPDPTQPAWQRKLAQRHYYGSRAWRRLFKRRGMVEGVFGILKNPSKQRLRRGHNRVAGIAIATLLSGIKVAVYNGEQARSCHERTGAGPADHPLLQPDAAYYGHKYLTHHEAADIDSKRRPPSPQTPQPPPTTMRHPKPQDPNLEASLRPASPRAAPDHLTGTSPTRTVATQTP